MFVVPSIQKEYIGSTVVKGHDGWCREKTINVTNINVPVNLNRVNYIEKDTMEVKETTFYQIVFQFEDYTKSWNFYKEEDRDSNYKKLIGLNSIGLFCNLGDME